MTAKMNTINVAIGKLNDPTASARHEAGKERVGIGACKTSGPRSGARWVSRETKACW